MDGLARLLASETNISDLLAYFTEKDPSGWNGILEAPVTEVLRESSSRSRNRADLILRSHDADAAAVEVKLGHRLSSDQVDAYEEAFGEGVPFLLASLDPSVPGTLPTGGRWAHVPLVELVARWLGSADPEVATFAAAAHRILGGWSALISAVASTSPTGEAEPVARITEPFLGRVLTRALEPPLREAGAAYTWAGVTSGGGNALLQAWVEIPGEAAERYFISEIRWAPAKKQMDFRFGIDVDEPGVSGRTAAWRLAQQLDHAIRADAFARYLKGVDPARAALLREDEGNGRPTAKGEWKDIVDRGFRHGDASQYNPGFYRDGDRRFEAMVKLDTAEASGEDIVSLLMHALTYLKLSIQ